MSNRKHWDAVYRGKPPTEVSWYQPEAVLSLDLIRRAEKDLDAPIIDVGGGASTLVDGLSIPAIARSQPRAQREQWTRLGPLRA